MYFVMLPLGGFHAFIIFPVVLYPPIYTPSLALHAPHLMHPYIDSEGPFKLRCANHKSSF